jgi:hypothetical protein
MAWVRALTAESLATLNMRIVSAEHLEHLLLAVSRTAVERRAMGAGALPGPAQLSVSARPPQRRRTAYGRGGEGAGPAEYIADRYQHLCRHLEVVRVGNAPCRQ